MSSKELSKANDEYSQFDDAFFEALKKFGYLFPETEEELEFLKQKLSKATVELPDNLKDPMKIIERGKITFLSEFNSSDDSIIEENLAMAARDGDKITDDIWEQMEKDRKEAEEKAKNKNVE